jgi:peptidoglycan/xylan/chitin deacetylase (PgdA/CDA1 family)
VIRPAGSPGDDARDSVRSETEASEKVEYAATSGPARRLLTGLRRAALTSFSTTGLAGAFARSEWRRRRLLVLCYHGVSLDDEHDWSGLYVSPALLERRLAWLRRHDYVVLPFADALEALDAGTLPPRAVALTFDDGLYDFSARAVPILASADAPAMLYLTTYYVRKQLPVFDPMLSYLLWKGAGGAFALPSLRTGTIGAPARHDVATREALVLDIRERTRAGGLSVLEKHAVLADLATQLRIDFAELCARRILHLMTPDEVAALDGRRVDVQLHTHRHRTPDDPNTFHRELVENAEEIRALRGHDEALPHFCYPSGVHAAWMTRPLERAGVVSATTCMPGIVSRETPRHFLPRFIDTEMVSDALFEAWASGFAALTSRSMAIR